MSCPFSYTVQRVSLCFVLAGVCCAYGLAQSDPNTASVQLISAGSDPKYELRFAPKVGTYQTCVMTTDSQTSMFAAGKPLPTQPTPVQTLKIRSVISNVKPNGDISFAFEFVDVTVQNGSNRSINLKGRAVSSTRGVIKSFEFDISKKIDPQQAAQLKSMKSSLTNVVFPVPNEAIGVGGKWEVKQAISNGGVELIQTSIHEITKINAESFSMNVSISQEAAKGDISNPALPPGTTMKLESIATDGKGVSSVNLDSIFPIKTEINTDSELEVVIESASEKQSLTS